MSNEPFGVAWLKQVSKLPKKDIINIIKTQGATLNRLESENAELRERLATPRTDADGFDTIERFMKWLIQSEYFYYNGEWRKRNIVNSTPVLYSEVYNQFRKEGGQNG